MSLRVQAVVEALLLVGWQILLLSGHQAHLDLHPCDAVLYQQNGWMLAQGQVAPGWLAWGPVQSLVYAGMKLVGVPVEAAQDAMALLVAIASTLGLYACLRWFVGRRFAWPFAALWAGSACVLHDDVLMLPPPTYLLSMALLWSGGACLLRGRMLSGSLLVGLAALERSEACLGLAVGAGVLACFVGGSARRRAALVAGGAVALLLVLQLDASVRERAWLAFGQHYAGAAEFGGRLAGVDADFTRPDALLARDFPGASSLGGAIVAGPGAMVRHVGLNVSSLPGALAGLLPFKTSPAWCRGVVLVAVAVVGLALVLARRRSSRLLGSRRAPLLAAFAMAVVATMVSLLLFPRAELLLAWVLPAAAGLGLATRVVVRTALVRGAAVLVFPALLLLFAPRPHAMPTVIARETRAIVRLLQRQAFRDGERFAVRFAETLQLFAPSSALQPVDLVMMRGQCVDAAQAATLLDERRPDVVLVSPEALTALGPLGAVLAAELQSDRWELVDLVFPVLLYRRSS